MIRKKKKKIVRAMIRWDFPDGSDGEESADNAGYLGSMPGSGGSPGEGNDYPL